MKMLLTGFEPGIGVSKTPSGELAKFWMREQPVPGLQVRSVILPQVFHVTLSQLCTEVDSYKPDFVMMYGATPTDDVVRIERFGINAIHTKTGDNTGIPVHDSPVLPGGPAAYETSLPYEELLRALDEHGIRARLSYFAGTHTCNMSLYGLRHHLSTTGRGALPVGFIHVPFPLEFGFGVVDDETGLMGWSQIRGASIIMAETMNRLLSKATAT